MTSAMPRTGCRKLTPHKKESSHFGRSGVLLTSLLILAMISSCSSKKPTDGNGKPHAFDYYPTWSSDGSSIAFMSESNGVGTDVPIAKLCVYDFAMKLVDTVWQASPLLVFDLAWSPDGEWLVFASDVGVYKINRSGDSLALLSASEFARQPCWTESTERILYVVNSSPDGGVFAVGGDGGISTRVAPSDLAITSIDCSEDGDTLACVQIGTDYCLSVYALNDSIIGDTVICGLAYADHVEISPDRSTLYFFGRPASGAELGLYSITRASSYVSYLANGYTFDISPDGVSLVYSDAANTKKLRLINLESGIDSPLATAHSKLPEASEATDVR